MIESPGESKLGAAEDEGSAGMGRERPVDRPGTVSDGRGGEHRRAPPQGEGGDLVVLGAEHGAQLRVCRHACPRPARGVFESERARDGRAPDGRPSASPGSTRCRSVHRGKSPTSRIERAYAPDAHVLVVMVKAGVPREGVPAENRETDAVAQQPQEGAPLAQILVFRSVRTGSPGASEPRLRDHGQHRGPSRRKSG